MNDTIILLVLAIGVAATLYSSVGHGGASAYIALMACAGLAPGDIRTAALVLNVVVAGLCAFRYLRAGRFVWDIFWPFAITAVPIAFLTGRIEIPEYIYHPLLAVGLGLGALRYVLYSQIDAVKPSVSPRKVVALSYGAALGALAGLTGIGGGIYLSPLLVYMGWADAQRATGIASWFIVVNSLAGLAGRISSPVMLPYFLPLLLGTALVGAMIGTTLSIKRLGKRGILRALGVVMGVAAIALVV